MPDYIDHTVSVLGQDYRLGDFTRQAEGTKKPTGDLPTFPGGIKNPNFSSASDPAHSVFEFDRLVPLPEEYSRYPYGEYGYEAEYSIWGTKGGAFQHELPRFEEGNATYRFTCAGDTPRLFFETCSRNWPDLWFIVSYGGSGRIRGYYVLHDGKYLENIQEKVNRSSPDHSEDDYEAGDAMNQWKEHYRNIHDEHVRQFITALFSGPGEDEC